MELLNNSNTLFDPCKNNKKFGLYISHPRVDLNALPKCDFNSLKEYFSQLDQKDLVSIIGGLQIHPCNHVHQVRLITSQHVACSLKNPSNPLKIKSDDFRSLLNQYLPTISELGLHEDPPERVFTENIAFHGGNYIVYPSIFHDENQYLTSIFDTLEFFQDQFPNEFLQDILLKSILILAISNEIASRLNHIRYMDSPYNWKSNRTDIYIPQDEEMERYGKSVIFSEEELKKLDSNFTIDKIKPFLQKLGKKEFTKLNHENSPFYRAPIVHYNNELIIVAPGALLIALRHYILTSARRYKIEKMLAERYREILWLNVKKYLFFMKFEELDELNFDIPSKFPINEGFFKIDTNKIAFVQLITDECLKYKNNEPKGIWDTQDLILKIRERDEEIIKSIREKDKVSMEIFIFKIFGSIGRSSQIRYENIESIRTLFLTYTELEAVAKSGRVDNLTLWKYVKADNDAKRFFHYFGFSFLDKFTLYCKNRTLIYDFRAMSHPMLSVPIPVGIGKDLRIKVAKNWDTHLEVIGDPSAYISVVNANQDPLVPIYISEYPIDGKICFLIKGYSQPIWIIYGEQVEQIPIEATKLVQGFCEAIAYWIWQFTPKLQDYLQNLGERPLHIIIKFRNPEVWYNYHNTFFSLDDSDNPIQYITNNRFATIIIPDNLLKKIAGQNNHGERMLCKAILLASSQILAKCANNFSLTNNVIDELIDDYAPIGRKKQILSVFAGVEGLLINNNLPEPRWLEKHDIQEQSLNLLNKLDLKKPKDDIFSEKQSKICNSIVNLYYHQLISKINEYDWKILLELLIAQHDSMLHHGILTNFFSTFIIESYSNEAEVVKKIAEQLPIIDQSTLCIRTLIEIIAAQPQKGDKRINTDDFDHLMALAYHLIWWGNLSNFYYHGLLHQNLKVGTGGRIFVENDDFSEKLSYFTREKVSESVHVSFDRFKDELKAEKNTESIQTNPQELEELDIACNAEFGLSFQEIMNFFFCLIHSMELFICPEQVGPVYSLPKSLLISRLMEKLSWSEAKVHRALEEFSLRQYESLEEFEDDFKPWKYCRRLAPTSRPLIISPEPEGDPLIIWGSLHSERSIKYLLELIQSGRFDISQSSSEMRSYIGKIQKERGEAFNDFVQKWFEENTSFIIHPRVNLPIRDQANQNNDNLGDIDILAIDEEEKIIYSFECKNINFGRNSSEIINEMMRLLKGTDDEESWLKKHADRDDWLKNNLSEVISNYSLKSRIYSVKSIIITGEAIPSIFLTDIEYSIPIIPFTQIEREGLLFFKNTE